MLSCSLILWVPILPTFNAYRGRVSCAPELYSIWFVGIRLNIVGCVSGLRVGGVGWWGLDWVCAFWEGWAGVDRLVSCRKGSDGPDAVASSRGWGSARRRRGLCIARVCVSECLWDYRSVFLKSLLHNSPSHSKTTKLFLIDQWAYSSNSSKWWLWTPYYCLIILMPLPAKADKKLRYGSHFRRANLAWWQWKTFVACSPLYQNMMESTNASNICFPALNESSKCVVNLKMILELFRISLMDAGMHRRAKITNKPISRTHCKRATDYEASSQDTFKDIMSLSPSTRSKYNMQLFSCAFPANNIVYDDFKL